MKHETEGQYFLRDVPSPNVGCSMSHGNSWTRSYVITNSVSTHFSPHPETHECFVFVICRIHIAQFQTCTRPLPFRQLKGTLFRFSLHFRHIHRIQPFWLVTVLPFWIAIGSIRSLDFGFVQTVKAKLLVCFPATMQHAVLFLAEPPTSITIDVRGYLNGNQISMKENTLVNVAADTFVGLVNGFFNKLEFTSMRACEKRDFELVRKTLKSDMKFNLLQSKLPTLTPFAWVAHSTGFFWFLTTVAWILHRRELRILDLCIVGCSLSIRQLHR